MSDDAFVRLYSSLFVGRPDVYAIRWEFERDGEKQSVYVPSVYTGNKEHVKAHIASVTQSIGSSHFGLEAIRAHLYGTHFLGVYPIHSDSTVKFFALDFDKEPQESWHEAVRQQKIFKEEAGLVTYIERSRSGNGYHLWGFLEVPINAGVLRHALSRFIEDSSTFDRMFPNQNGVTEARPLGNLIALPLFGPTVADRKGVFVEPEWNGFDVVAKEVDQRAYLANISRIPKQTLDYLFQSAPTPMQQERMVRVRSGEAEGSIPGAFKMIHPVLGCEWIRWCWDNPEEVTEPEWYAMACQFAQLQGGRELFHQFSAQDPVRYNPRNTDQKFDHAVTQNAPHSCQYIRENLSGPPCHCDSRFPGKVYHPYDLATIPFYDLLEDMPDEGSVSSAKEGLNAAVKWAKEMVRNPGSVVEYEYGIETLDKHTSIRPSDLIIVAGRPGRGKTAFVLDTAIKAVQRGEPCYIFSLEMSRDQLWRRTLANIAQVNATRLMKGELGYSEWRRVLKTQQWWNSYPLPMLVDDVIRDSEQIINRAAELVAEHGPGIIIIDYLQLAAPKHGESMYEMNSRLPREYKLLAKALNVPVMVATQMNRSGEDATEKSETFDSMIEGSGKIEQAADVILYILGPRGPGIVSRTLVVHKERHRESGHRIPLDFNQPLMSFSPAGTWARQATKSLNVTPQQSSEALTF